MAKIARRSINGKALYVIVCSSCKKRPATRKRGHKFMCDGCFGITPMRQKETSSTKLVNKNERKRFQIFVKEVRNKLASMENEDLLIAAIRCLWRFQTEREKQLKDSIETNGVGFNKPDAHALSWAMVQIDRGHKLYSWRINDARKRIPKYAEQIARAMVASSGTRKQEIFQLFGIYVPLFEIKM